MKKTLLLIPESVNYQVYINQCREHRAVWICKRSDCTDLKRGIDQSDKDRMELTGMRWRTDGAQAMLDLRSVFLNGDWEAFQQHRIKINNRKLYPERELIESKWSAAA